jgi:hypothetical protein
MKSHLKVKVFSLSAEMSYIRRQEEKWKNKAKIARQKALILSDPEVIGKTNAFLTYAERNFWSQHWHRYQLKTEARTAHLAYGCMRGMAYSRMEAICYGPLKGYGSTEPDWEAIGAMVGRFSVGEDDQQGIMQKYAEWLADAKTWYEGNPDRIKERAMKPTGVLLGS